MCEPWTSSATSAEARDGDGVISIETLLGLKEIEKVGQNAERLSDFLDSKNRTIELFGC